MTTGPSDERPAAPGRMRAARADREQVVSALKTAFVAERLTKDEFDVRVGRALAARTYAQLAVIIADIPAAAPVQPDTPVPSPRPALSVRSGACVSAVAAVLAAVLWSAALAGGSAAAGAAALALSGVVIVTVFMTGYQVREARHPGHPARPLPPGTPS